MMFSNGDLSHLFSFLCRLKTRQRKKNYRPYNQSKNNPLPVWEAVGTSNLQNTIQPRESQLYTIKIQIAGTRPWMRREITLKISQFTLIISTCVTSCQRSTRTKELRQEVPTHSLKTYNSNYTTYSLIRYKDRAVKFNY